jgi:hypothetical protein
VDFKIVLLKFVYNQTFSTIYILLRDSNVQNWEYNKVISDFAHFQNPHVVRQITKYFFNIVGQHEYYDIKHNIVRQNLSIIIQSVSKLNIVLAVILLSI